jgi:hypothetical protein
MLWLGPLVMVPTLAIHLALQENRRGEVKLLLAAGLLGLLFDTAFVAGGVFTPLQHLLPRPFSPPWMVCLWLNFAATLNVSMAWLRGRYILAVIFGAIGGPLAYYSGAKLGATESLPTPTGMLLLAIGWGLMTPLLVRLAHQFNRRNMNFLIMILLLTSYQPALAATCSPTPWDEIGPFYRPSAPERTSIGKGYLLSGTVRSAGDCRPLYNVRIELWQAGPDGTYDDAHRTTLFSDHADRYRLETSVPPPYGHRPSHIHILVDAKGFEGLITQHYPKKGKKAATFDLVLEAEKQGEGKARNPVGQ